MDDGEARPTGATEPTLGVLLANRAARLSDLSVATLVSGGFLLAIVSAFWPRDIRLTASFVCVLSFGAWEAVRRSRQVRPRSGILHAAEILAAAMGISSVFAIALSLLALALGTWIS